MKKVLLFIIFLFMPIFINAGSINKLYIDSEIDVSGNLIVKEIIDFDELSDDPFNIYYKNDIEEKYKGTALLLRKVGVLDDIESIKYFYDDTFYDAHVITTNEFEQRDDNEYVNITFKEKNVYYIEYIVLNLCVEYNDAAEIYYRYLYNFNYDIKDGIITLRLPRKSNIFKPFVHSNIKAKATSDIENSILSININNYKRNKYLDVRLLFDKEIFSININKNKIIDTNILNNIYIQEYKHIIIDIIIYILIALILFIIISTIYSSLNINITHYNIKSNKIKSNNKLLVLSDLHDRKINNRLVKIIKKEKPDSIIISGDMIDGSYISNKIARKKMKYFIRLLNKLKDFNIYYTFGNHESFLPKILFKEYKNMLKETHVKLLNNSSVFLTDDIRLSGIFYDIKYYNRKKNPITKEFIKEKLGTIDKKKYNIIVNHNPLGPEPFSEYGYDVMISGHVHGGIVRLPVALLSPEFKFFPKYSSGLYNIGNMKLFVSRGLGFSKYIPFRTNNSAHIIVINLNEE